MIKAIAITGPTASGKTALSIGLAKRVSGEIISLDSMQIYEGMDIGTAKATESERAAVKHHMLDFLPPTESFSANAYKEMALPIAEHIAAQGGMPIFVGGTGLYLSTLMRPECESAPPSSREYREAVERSLVTEKDRIDLWERLYKIDKASADAVHYNNVRRVIRALEIYDATGKTKSYFDELTRAKNGRIEIFHITIDFHSRDALYNRVDTRVDAMMREGLFKEVRELYEKGLLIPETTAAQAIGYKEIVEHIEGGITLAEAVENIKKSSRNYAKRQLTWFRNQDGAHTVYKDTEDGKIKNDYALLCECFDMLRDEKFV
jgi:tRNA dimethylallyltransferase